MLYGLLVFVHVVVSVILILVVLLQTGKGADLAGAFGGGGSQTAFGARGAATFLTKMTTSAAVIFMLTSISLAILSTRDNRSVLDTTSIPVPQAPAAAGGTAAGPAPDPGTPAEEEGNPLLPPEEVDPDSAVSSSDVDPAPTSEAPGPTEASGGTSEEPEQN